ncbi:vWA domain-containing protein [Acanthopleuribacter pedis]|uniref:VWA domain-containing protein n=1 Tax=Acanthopleuribacter pedis TaxID=442870 RepID=A0A8J7Q817_9BACT|nr:vWA domain-containing protein [Acanthopleuribacter pedis]MBO1319860.1 VWA domain-containing protein [Acanthopleuribacter pedis]
MTASKSHRRRIHFIIAVLFALTATWWLPAADRLILRTPAPNTPLENPQDFLVETLGEAQPRRVDIRLNGKLVRARRSAPFQFSINWNPEFQNTIEIVAHFSDGTVEKIERTYEPPRVDVTTEVRAFEIWPFLNKPLGDQQPFVTFAGQRFEPQKVVSAATTPLDLVIVLDISGSMRDLLPGMTAPMKTFIEHQLKAGHQVRLIVFDGEPRLLNLDAVRGLSSLETLFRGQSKSVVWDSLATASGMFSQSTRRLILLISDAMDDGSRHDRNTAATFIRSAGTSLVWFNATGKIFGKMTRLTRRTGGFELSLQERPWQVLQQRLDNQIQLIVPEVSFPLTLNGLAGRVWYPRWQTP